MADTRTDPQYKLRLPADLKERIEAAALRNSRSMNAEIVSALIEKYPPILTARDIGLIEHFRDIFEDYKTGDEQKDAPLRALIARMYFEVMERFSVNSAEEMQKAEPLAELHSEINKMLELRPGWKKR